MFTLAFRRWFNLIECEFNFRGYPQKPQPFQPETAFYLTETTRDKYT